MIFQLVDLPGAYSLNSESPDEKVTAGYINSQEADLILIVADATCLERNLLLVREILSVTSDAVLCLNLTDEAARKGMITDTARLSSILGIPVIPTAARDRRGLDLLVKEIYRCCTDPAVAGHDYTSKTNTELPEASEIYRQCTTVSNEEPNAFDRKLDRVLTSRIWGLPIMLTMLFIVFWITMSGANYPSAALAYLFDITGKLLTDVLSETSLPEGCISFLTDGVYKSVSWVVSVMLPPMAIFFPLFTLLEDFGYLPRVAFNLDNSFRKCGAHGKQASYHVYGTWMQCLRRNWLSHHRIAQRTGHSCSHQLIHSLQWSLSHTDNAHNDIFHCRYGSFQRCSCRSHTCNVHTSRYRCYDDIFKTAFINAS